MLIININGPINSGKTTICRLLEKRLPASLFIEVDDLLSDTEQDDLCLDFMGGIKERLNRLDAKIKEEKKSKKYRIILFAYPMEVNNYARWKRYEDQYTRFINITLSPRQEVCLTNRGHRELTLWEIQRIKQMYQEGYQCPQQSDFLIDNSDETAEQSVLRIEEFLKHKSFLEL